MFEQYAPQGGFVPPPYQMYPGAVNPLYPAAQPQQMPQQQAQGQATAPVNTNMIFVSGPEEVKARPLPFNSEVIFLDNEKSRLYKKTVAANGQFEVAAFDIVPVQEESTAGFATAEEVAALREELAALRGKMGGAEE